MFLCQNEFNSKSESEQRKSSIFMTCYTNITSGFKSMNDSPKCPFVKRKTTLGGHRNVNFEVSACK